MNLEMIQGPGGPQRCEDGGGRLVIAGETIAAGDVLIADYGNAALTGLPNSALSPESTYIKVDLAGVGYAKQANALFCVATEAAAVGEKFRAVFTGYVVAEAVATIPAAKLEVGVDISNGKFGPIAIGDMVLGRGLGTEIVAGAKGLVWFDGTSAYAKTI